MKVQSNKPKKGQNVSMEKKILDLERRLASASASRSRPAATTAERMVGAAPAAFGKTHRNSFSIRAHPKYKDGIVIEAQEYLSPLTVPAAPNTSLAGAILAGGEVYIAPFEFEGTRLARFAELYEKYRMTKFEFEYVPALPTTQPGSIVLAYDRDIQDTTPPATRDGLRQLCAYEGAQYGPVWKPFKSNCKLQAPDTGYYTSPGTDERLCYQGQVYVAQMEPTGLAAGAVIGDLLVRYECELFVPQVESTDQSATVTAGASVAPVIADVLRQYVTSGGAVANAGSEATFSPKLDSNGNGQVELTEGVYQLVNSVVNNVAGLTQFLAPTLTLKDAPGPAGPQPIIQAVAAANAPAAIGATAAYVYQMSVPKGGAFLRQAATTVAGLTAAATMVYRLQKLSSSYSQKLFV